MTFSIFRDVRRAGIVMAACLLGGCAGVHAAKGDSVPLDESFRIYTVKGTFERKYLEINNIFRLDNLNDKLRVCGAYKSNDPEIAAILYLDVQSAIWLDKEKKLRISPVSFDHVDENTRIANCVVLDTPWKEEYRTAKPTFHLQRTRMKYIIIR